MAGPVRSPSVLSEARSYLGFSPEDAELLARLRPLARPYFAAIADEFYAVIRLHEGAFAVLRDEAQARRLNASLQTWLDELLAGPHDEQYAARHARIGQVHVQIGLQLRYMVTAMGRLRVALERVAEGALAAEPDRLRATRAAIGRVCDLDLAIMLESYKEDIVGRADRLRAREHEAVASRLDGLQRFFGDALDVAEVLVLGFDPSGRLLFANRKTEALTGYAADELGHGDVFARLFAACAAEVRSAWMGAATGIVVENETDVLTRSGKACTVRWHASSRGPAAAALDEPAIVVVGVDVTRERELEREARQNERLAAAGTLAAGLAHEIRNPLNGASLHLAVLERVCARYPALQATPAHDAIDVLRAEIKRLSTLVSDFLEVARPKPLSRADCDVNEIARAVDGLLRPEAEARQVELELRPSPFPAMAHLDGERIKQVLVNLVRNALEAVSEGGHVAVRVRHLPRDIEIDVADDGPGIAGHGAEIFDAFFTTKERGTGLGLSIVRRIVTDHGGRVTFASEPGSTVFTVRLPAPPTAPKSG
jgi:PAS domain S-box-containing protein